MLRYTEHIFESGCVKCGQTLELTMGFWIIYSELIKYQLPSGNRLVIRGWFFQLSRKRKAVDWKPAPIQ